MKKEGKAKSLEISFDKFISAQKKYGDSSDETIKAADNLYDELQDGGLFEIPRLDLFSYNRELSDHFLTRRRPHVGIDTRNLAKSRICRVECIENYLDHIIPDLLDFDPNDKELIIELVRKFLVTT